MLTNKKHINEDGVKIQLSNIRLKVFGKTPNFTQVICHDINCIEIQFWYG